jgi:hypothetical protein
MNSITLTDCFECWEHRPADSYGCGCFCDLAKQYVPMVEETAPIPDWCPKLEKIKLMESSPAPKNI